MSEEPDHKASTTSWLTEGMLLLLGPALGYLLVYGYERGYCAAFSVPSSFVRPDLVSAVGVAFVTLFYIYVFVPTIDGFRHREWNAEALNQWRKRGNVAWVIILLTRWVPLTCLIVVGVVVVVADANWPVVVACLLGYFAVDFTLVALRFDASKPLLERLASTPTFFLAEGMPHGILAKRFGMSAMTIAVIAVFGPIISALLGRSNAINQTDFWVPASHPNAVLVRSYGDKFICVELDAVTRKPRENVIIITSTDDKFSRFSATNLGKILLSIPHQTPPNPPQIPTQTSGPPAVSGTNSP